MTTQNTQERTPSDLLQHIQFEGCDVCVIAPEDYDHLQAELAAVKARNEGLEKDAARYRWLRNDCDYMDEQLIRNGDEIKCGEALDAAIDAALREHTPRDGGV